MRARAADTDVLQNRWEEFGRAFSPEGDDYAAFNPNMSLTN
jgi:hypothetical protein